MTDHATGFSAAWAALAAGALEEAHALAMAGIKAGADPAEGMTVLGLIAAAAGQHAKAVDVFERALGFSRRADTLAYLARSRIALHDKPGAVSAATEAAALGRAAAHVEDTLGVVFTRAGLHARAVPHFEAATAAAPREAAYWYNLGAARQFVGAMAGARAAYEACIVLEPTHARALAALVQLEPQSRAQNRIAALEACLGAASEEDALLLGHALAKTWEDLGDAQAALDALFSAKAARAARLRPKVDRDLFAAAARAATDTGSAKGHGTDDPVFIVGMPRTGTTLLDRILTRHSALTSAGELSDFALAVKRMTATPGRLVLDAPTLDAARALDPEVLGAAYVSAVRAAQGVRGRFTDKMPLNFFLAPHILRALPRARIVALDRHPADTVLSNFRQLFATSFAYYDYAYDLTVTAEYVAAFRDLLSVYRSALPPTQFRVQSYESLIDDHEAEVRSLLDFLGLPFEPACLRFEENDAPVATASAVQVRAPLNRHGIGRWRRYRPGLDPALAILAARDPHLRLDE